MIVSINWEYGLSNYASEPTINLRWKQLFNNIDWGTDRVFKQTIDIAANLNFNTHYLSVLRDVDRPEDLVVWRST